MVGAPWGGHVRDGTLPYDHQQRRGAAASPRGAVRFGAQVSRGQSCVCVLPPGAVTPACATFRDVVRHQPGPPVTAPSALGLVGWCVDDPACCPSFHRACSAVLRCRVPDLSPADASGRELVRTEGYRPTQEEFSSLQTRCSPCLTAEALLCFRGTRAPVTSCCVQ